MGVYIAIWLLIGFIPSYLLIIYNNVRWTAMTFYVSETDAIYIFLCTIGGVFGLLMSVFIFTLIVKK